MTVTASNLKQHFHLLDEARREPITVTKRGRPYVVVLDHETYRELQKQNGQIPQEKIPPRRKKLDALDSLGTYKLGGKDIYDIKASMYDPS
jgi:prevent-host-death family protein